MDMATVNNKVVLTSEHPDDSVETGKPGKELTYLSATVKTKYNLGDRVYYIVRRGEEFEGRNYINEGVVVGVKVVFHMVGKKAVNVEEKYEIHNDGMYSRNLNIFGHNLFGSPKELCDSLLGKPLNKRSQTEWEVKIVEPGTSYVTYDTNPEFGPIGLRTHIIDKVYMHALNDNNGVVRTHIKYVTDGRKYEHEYELSWTVEEWLANNYRKYID